MTHYDSLIGNGSSGSGDIPRAGAVVGGPLDGVPQLLVFAGGQHEAGQLQDLAGGEVFWDGQAAYPAALDQDDCRKVGRAEDPHVVLLSLEGLRRTSSPT